MSVFLERYAEEEVEVPLGYRNLLATIIGIQADPTTVEVIFGKYDWIEGGPQIIEIFKACPRHVDLMQQQSKRELWEVRLQQSDGRYCPMYSVPFFFFHFHVSLILNLLLTLKSF